ncbi:2-oxoacid:acceptor oxidoreductase family protein [Mariniflexile sp. HMF6888]|uniref:2-oxoacid:acceptor oxidoreductase family protein n=1 Tax=Mariniflexile sp. HMF6888 TaxID=3373086 RepID=UPI00378A0276
MKTSEFKIVNANQAVAQIAYKTNEVMPIYPITPASEMSELVEQWRAEKKENCFGNVPTVFQMQSEAGVAGAMHGALQTGSLATTFTASQGLLLMLPNMYKIAGELTPNVIHVATRSIATHALSVFGDHSDVMAVRQSGYAMLASASVQEAQDFALISQVASLRSKLPFIHFFDGFRTSHEISKIETIEDDIIKFMMNTTDIKTHKERALNPNNPVIRGTSQGPDVFFQSREKINPYYNNCPDSVQQTMNTFASFTGRPYHLFDYFGHQDAEHIIISMASSTETIEETITYLNKKGERYGLVKVRLFRPFSSKHLLKAIPTACKSIAVLDRTKEPGSTGEPLYLDVVKSISEAFQNRGIHSLPRIIGGRYGLSSKEFTPHMVHAIFENLKQEYPKNNFTIGIKDDVTNLSLEVEKLIPICDMQQAIFYENKHKSITQNLNNTLQIIGNQENILVQGYTECDYKKSNSRSVSHIRIASKPIKAPYLIENADFIACENLNFLEKDNVLHTIKKGGTILVNTANSTKKFWESISQKKQNEIIEKNIDLFIINSREIDTLKLLQDDHISIQQACFLAIQNQDIHLDFTAPIKDYIYKVDTSILMDRVTPFTEDDDFSKTLLGRLLNNKDTHIPVSLLPADGTYPTNTSLFNTIEQTDYLPDWDTNICSQCGACSMACPQGALRIKVYDDHYLNDAPKQFKSLKSNEEDWEVDLLNYTIQINPEQCNGCNNCVDACSIKALKMVKKKVGMDEQKINWKYFETIPEFDRNKIDVDKVSQQQLQEPLFKYPMGVKGCGEAPYLKLLSQLFGDRLLIANATGTSSIIGGALPTTPWGKNKNGQGPAWSNSLFEDNAEFGLGFKLSLEQQENQAKNLLQKLLPKLNFDLVYDILNANQSTEKEINQQRVRIETLKQELKTINSFEANQLLTVCDALIKKSIWIVGGDGWAYDIGYGGIDHVLASGKNVNILVLDNEVYENTGAQASKATPFGAQAKFEFTGKQKQKKDLGLLAMTYDNVYVASVAIGANQAQTLKAFNEAESFDGPSIIIAYCHSESHGIDMENPKQYHKAAVNSGQWLLYRNDPRKEKNKQNTFQLDSKAPSIEIRAYMQMQNRFNKIIDSNKSEPIDFFSDLQAQVNRRFKKYSLLNIDY